MLGGLKHPKRVLAFWIFLSIAATYFCSGLKFNYDFETFFPDNDPALPFFKDHRNTFGYDNEFILIALENKEGIFQKDFLKKVQLLTDSLKKVKYVVEVLSPTNLKTTSLGFMVQRQSPLMHPEQPDLYAYDSLQIYTSPQWQNTFFSSDARSLCLHIRSAEGISKKKSDSLAFDLRTCVERFSFEKVHYAGRIFAQAVYLRKLQEQFVTFLITSFFLISLLLWLTFKKIGAVLLPLSVVLLSLLLTFGIMAFLGNSIDIMAVMIPSMVFVAGMSDVVHFYTKYTDETGRNKEQEAIFRMIYKEVAGPTFLTLVSTVAGFLSLCYSGVKPIRDFGIFTSVGITIAYLLTYTYLPAVLTLFPARRHKEKAEQRDGDRQMQTLFSWVIRNGKLVGLATCIIMILSVWGLSRLKTNQSILEDLPNKEPIKQDLVFFEKQYGGVRPFELAVKIKKGHGTLWDRTVLEQLNRVEEAVRMIYRPGFLFSPASLAKSVNFAYDDQYMIPSDTSDLDRDIKVLKTNKRSQLLKAFVTPDGTRGRFSAKMSDAGSRALSGYNRSLLNYIKYHTDTTTLDFTITGTANLIDINNQNLITNTLQGLLTGIGVLALLTLWLHRSLRMVLVFLIPNIVPLVIMAGIMGFFGIELKSSTAIFFSIAFGIATDDTIHFISRFRLELKKGISPLRAFRLTYFETGKAVLLTTLVLLGGFISLITSDFMSIYLFGLLTAITLFVALISEIFLLPVLLTFLFKKK